MILKRRLLIAPTIIALLSLAACGSDPIQPKVEAGPEIGSVSRAAAAEPALPATVAGNAAPSASPTAVAAAECPPQEAGRGSPAALKTRVTSICFAQNKTAPDSEDGQLLRRHAALLKQDRRLVVTLTAFTDHRGSPNYNLAVTGKWLRAVTAALADLGVPRHQIRKDAYPRREDRRACTGACPPEVPRVELRYRK